MSLRALPKHGVPLRGSLQDRILQEMLVRERRESISKQVYLARILAAGMHLPQEVFDLWTTLYAMEVNHDNYAPSTLEHRKEALTALEAPVTDARDQDMIQRTQEMEQSNEQARPATDEEMEYLRRRLRQRHLNKVKE